MAVGATLAMVSGVTAVNVRTSVSRRVTVRGVASPSRPSASRSAHDSVGVAPVASPNVPSPLTSHEYVAPGPASEAVPSRVSEVTLGDRVRAAGIGHPVDDLVEHRAAVVATPVAPL